MMDWLIWAQWVLGIPALILIGWMTVANMRAKRGPTKIVETRDGKDIPF